MGSIARTTATGAASWSADTSTLVPADGTVQLVSTDPNRSSVTVINDIDSTGDLYVVPSSTQGRGGVRVAPGAALVLATVAPVYGYVRTGQAVAYLVAESGVVC